MSDQWRVIVAYVPTRDFTRGEMWWWTFVATSTTDRIEGSEYLTRRGAARAARKAIRVRCRRDKIQKRGIEFTVVDP